MDLEGAIEEHRHLEKSLNAVNESAVEKNPTSRGTKMKKLASQVLLDAIRIDKELGIHMLEMYQKGWLAVAERTENKDFESLEDYFAFRMNNFGMR